MDKSIELIMVIAVTVVVAGIVVFLVQGEADNFLEFSSDSISSGECEVHVSKAERLCEGDDGSIPQNLKDNLQECSDNNYVSGGYESGCN